MQTALSPAAFQIATVRRPARADVLRSPALFEAATRPSRSLVALLGIGLLAVGLLVAGVGIAGDVGRGVAIAERCSGACTEVPVLARVASPVER